MHRVNGWLRSNWLPVAASVVLVISAVAYIVDDTRLWCGVRPSTVVRTGDVLGLPASRFVRHKAEVEEAALVFDWARARELEDDWITRQGAVDGDPHPGWGSMLSWETEAPGQFALACAATRLGIGS